MVSVVFGMLVCVGLALAVLALVAIPAHRAGREVLSERGEQVIDSIRERQRGAVEAAETGDPEIGDPETGETVGARGATATRDHVVGARG